MWEHCITDDFRARISSINNFTSLVTVKDKEHLNVNRTNIDKKINQDGLDLIRFCTSYNLPICNSHITPEFSSTWFFFNHEGSSVVDYALTVCQKCIWVIAPSHGAYCRLG